MSSKRALHFVLKVGSLKKNLEFFRDKLGMTVLRHEVFDEGCEAACNGPYDRKWSKTMIGYGPEDDHFVLELTYNYSIGRYQVGNDLQRISISVDDLMFKSIQNSLNIENDNELQVESPDGYKFKITRNSEGVKKNDIKEVCLASGVGTFNKSLKYWNDLLGMRCIEKSNSEAIMNYSDDQANLRLLEINETIDHKSAYGRIAFSCQSDELKVIQKRSEDAGETVLTPFLSLDTPGKATVQVVILADPNDHEICFVGDEGFRELSKVDPDANSLIEKSILEDKSDE